jgi:hypothetical protein
MQLGPDAVSRHSRAHEQRSAYLEGVTTLLAGRQYGNLDVQHAATQAQSRLDAHQLAIYTGEESIRSRHSVAGESPWSSFLAINDTTPMSPRGAPAGVGVHQ